MQIKKGQRANNVVKNFNLNHKIHITITKDKNIRFDSARVILNVAVNLFKYIRYKTNLYNITKSL